MCEILLGAVNIHLVSSGCIQANGIHQPLGSSDVDLEVKSYL